MDFSETVFIAIGPILISLILFAATLKGLAWNRKIGYGLALLFLFIGVSLGLAAFFKAEILVVSIITFPLGGFTSFMGLKMITDVFRYSQKSEGEFLGTKHAYLGKGSIVYHSLIFTYRLEEKIFQNSSDDFYKPQYIERHYDRHQTYPIWLDPKKPEQFRVKRFYRLAAGIFAALLGFSLLWIPFDMLL